MIQVLGMPLILPPKSNIQRKKNQLYNNNYEKENSTKRKDSETN